MVFRPPLHPPAAANLFVGKKWISKEVGKYDQNAQYISLGHDQNHCAFFGTGMRIDSGTLGRVIWCFFHAAEFGSELRIKTNTRQCAGSSLSMELVWESMAAWWAGPRWVRSWDTGAPAPCSGWGTPQSASQRSRGFAWPDQECCCCFPCPIVRIGTDELRSFGLIFWLHYRHYNE